MIVRPSALACAIALVVGGGRAALGQDAAPTPEPVKGADVELLRTVRSVGDRIATIVGRQAKADLVAVRADEGVRAAAAKARAETLCPSTVAAARGRAWKDLGLGGIDEPADLALSLALDLPGMTLDAVGTRLLVDPNRLTPGSGRGDPNEDAEASLLLATGVAPDEPVAGHYAAHLLTDDASPPRTTDALVARAALSEGTANVASLILLFGGVGLEAEVVGGKLRPEDALGGRLVASAQHPGGPAVGAFIDFIYLDGFAQAAALAKSGEFRRLLAERKTRRTTRDVMHLDRPPAPAASLPQPVLPPALPWTVADQDTLGEEGIVVLVSLLTGKDNLGLMAGDGWAGDALWRFEAPDGSDGLTIWSTRWISADEAKDFEYALERSLMGRFPGEEVHDAGPGVRILARPDRQYRIDTKDIDVTLTVAAPAIDAVLRGEAQKKKGPPARSSAPKK
ncbi:MAG TPA: hypothetical protein VFV19_03885 [Candidatus Polarisedimenticolaceae bacterium]|nr:hypothetical protein [Candidatus Polarisedimenticolaceae bacterium]